MRGICLRFENGRVVQASAEHGEDFLLSQLDLDDGARTLGEFAIGTNKGIQRFTGSTLFVDGGWTAADGRYSPNV